MLAAWLRAALAALLMSIMPLAALAEPAGVLDGRHLSVEFQVLTFGFWSVEGRFKDVSGEIAPGRGEGAGRVRLKAAATSIDTGSLLRDARLRSSDFFDAANHPFVTFESIRATRDETGAGSILGNLSMRGITNPITMDFKLECPRMKHASRVELQPGRLVASGSVRRSAWGMTALSAAVGDEVLLRLEARVNPHQCASLLTNLR